MHWIILVALSREPGFDGLMASLQNRGLPHTVVRKPPFADYLVDQNDQPITLEIEEPVFVLGSSTMEDVSLKHGWTPGYINAPNFDDCLANWGDLMLNHDSVTGRIDEIQVPDVEEFFTRPVEDTKSVPGRVMTPEKFEDWRQGVLAIDSFTTIPPETMLQIAPLKEIWAEYRCMMVGGQYATGSRYRSANKTEYHPDVGPMIINFANECAEMWNPRHAYALDIAHTPEGLKIIETNSICSAGFYSSNLDHLVLALENFHASGGFEKPA